MSILLIFLASLGIGFFASILGIGGGIAIVPLLSLGFGIDIRYAVAASLVAMIATSSGAAASFLKDHLTNLRVAVFLEIGTVSGAIIGFLLSFYIKGAFLYFLFGGVLTMSGFLSLRKRKNNVSKSEHPLAEKLNFSNQVLDPATRKRLDYKAENPGWALGFMTFAGILSSLLGIGSGVMKVLAMDEVMKLPTKVSSATSNFMIGVTAVASALAYFMSGDVKPAIIAPLALGILTGAWFGSKIMLKLPSALIKKAFVTLIFIIAVQMIYKGYSLLGQV